MKQLNHPNIGKSTSFNVSFSCVYLCVLLSVRKFGLAGHFLLSRVLID